MFVKYNAFATLTLVAFIVAACDFGDSDDSLSTMAAGIWIDGNGCDHWIIDDGLEGYMSPRFGADGKPVCRDGSVPYSTVDFERTLLGL